MPFGHRPRKLDVRPVRDRSRDHSETSPARPVLGQATEYGDRDSDLNSNTERGEVQPFDNAYGIEHDPQVRSKAAGCRR